MNIGKNTIQVACACMCIYIDMYLFIVYSCMHVCLPIRKSNNFEVMGHKRVSSGKTGLCKSVKSAGCAAISSLLKQMSEMVVHGPRA